MPLDLRLGLLLLPFYAVWVHVCETLGNFDTPFYLSKQQIYHQAMKLTTFPSDF